MTITERDCRVCGEIFAVSDLVPNRQCRGGVERLCRGCDRVRRVARYEANREGAFAATRRWQGQNPERVAEYQRRHALRKAGANYEDDAYARLLGYQGNRCAICRAEPVDRGLATDHDHETGQVRGLLCDSCNRALGMFADDPDRLAAAIAYLATDWPEVHALLTRPTVDT